MRTSLIGSRWKAIVNGRKCLNGKPYSVTLHGSVEAEDGDENLYDVIQQLAESLRTENAEMELPHSIHITIETPEENRP